MKKTKKMFLASMILFCLLTVSVAILPNVKADNTNIIPFVAERTWPDLPAWTSYEYVSTLGEPYSSNNANIHVDYTNTFQGNASIRIDTASMDGGTGTTQESDGGAVGGGTLAVATGAVIYFSAWIKTSTDAMGMTNNGYDGTHSGGRLGIDYYGAGYIGGQAYDGDYVLTTEIDNVKLAQNDVAFGTSEWTFRSITTHMPATVMDANGVVHDVNSIIPWLELDSFHADTGSAWFANITLMINPSSPQPTSSPTGSPTNTPTSTPTATVQPTSSGLTVTMTSMVYLIALIVLIVMMLTLVYSAIKHPKPENMLGSIVTFILIIFVIYLMTATGIL